MEESNLRVDTKFKKNRAHVKKWIRQYKETFREESKKSQKSKTKEPEVETDVDTKISHADIFKITKHPRGKHATEVLESNIPEKRRSGRILLRKSQEFEKKQLKQQSNVKKEQKRNQIYKIETSNFVKGEPIILIISFPAEVMAEIMLNKLKLSKRRISKSVNRKRVRKSKMKTKEIKIVLQRIDDEFCLSKIIHGKKTVFKVKSKLKLS
jgi:hypothetical protein